MNFTWESRIVENLWQIIDEMRTVLRPDALQLAGLAHFKKNIFRGKSDRRREKALMLKPAHGCSMQIVARTDERLTSLVTDDENGNRLGAAVGNEIDHTRKRRCFQYGATVGLALQSGPGLFAAGLSQIIADLHFVPHHAGRNQRSLRRQPAKELVVADDRVVEVDADSHGVS